MTRSTIWTAVRIPGVDPPLRICPGAVCDLCRRFDYTPITRGGRCYWCFEGTFTHRGEWRFEWCPTCGGEDPFCRRCYGKRIVAVPA